METPKTLQQAIIFFADAENCRQFMISIRWADGIVHCPYCDATKLTWLAKAQVYRCYGNHPKQKFSLKVGTLFEDSPLPLSKWLPAAWLISNCKNGISSYEVARALGVTQKSAWHMLHRLREAMTDETGKIGGSGPVECDETFVGGKVKNMHKSKRPKIATQGVGNKTIVMGMLERGGRVKAQVIADLGIMTYFDDQPEALKGISPTVNVMLVRNGGNFEKGRWLMSDKTGKIV